ncbi:hypothetical protein HID58_043424 [Brassica napus]|uniref:Uncharacterized protein n=1 Tax=Brassica napus TaxID=3708 RepID=A0ABQ8BI77_BRANA|nr:hypothetical protein HID58_043424 [Brassica napus]
MGLESSKERCIVPDAPVRAQKLRQESDTTVPDSPARAEKFAESWNLLKYGEILEDLKNDPKSHGEILEDFSLTKLPRSFS